MKTRLIVLLGAAFCTLTSFAQNPVSVHFDECVDLTAMVWRLSGSREYNMCMVPQFSHNVDSTFAQFKEHQAVKLASQYRELGISYDAVASYGLHLTVDNNGNIALDNNFLEGSDDSFKRWSDQQKNEFLEPLNNFYHETHFHEWFLQQKTVYAQVEKTFNDINQKVDYDWFNKYFGSQSDSQFGIVLSLLIGPQNYGCSYQAKDSSIVLSPIIGSCQVDDKGNFVFDANLVLPIVIHEFCHHFCNRLNVQYWSLMDKFAEKVFQEKKDQLKKTAYTTALIMMHETFVRASVIRYMKTHYPQVNESELIKNEDKNGFILTQTLCDALKQYEQQRDSYATMSDFMPSLAKAVNNFDLKQYKKQQQKLAKQNATYKVNIKDGATNVPSGNFTVVIKFSKPMNNVIALHFSSSGADFPTLKGYNWSDDKTLKIDFFLEPSHRYGFMVYGAAFTTKDGHNAGKSLEINFSTGE